MIVHVKIFVLILVLAVVNFLAADQILEVIREVQIQEQQLVEIVVEGAKILVRVHAKDPVKILAEDLHARVVVKGVVRINALEIAKNIVQILVHLCVREHVVMSVLWVAQLAVQVLVRILVVQVV